MFTTHWPTGFINGYQILLNIIVTTAYLDELNVTNSNTSYIGTSHLTEIFLKLNHIHTYIHTTQPARIQFRQKILHSQKVCKFWSLFVYRITGAIQKNPPLVLPFSDFFKLLFESYIGDLPKIKSLLSFGLFWAVPQSTFV